MTKAELIEKIARSRDLPPDITKKCIGQILDLAFGELSGYFVRAKVTKAQNPRFTFPSFGTFTKKKRSARRGVNPRTLEPIHIDASFTLDFKPSGDLREGMNTGKRPVKKNKKRTAKKTTKKSARKRSSAPAPRRKLTPRDDLEVTAELELAQDFFGDELPDAPMQRKRPKGQKKSGTR